MPILLVAIGNTLRRDDGAGARVLDLLGPLEGAVSLHVMQLTPELAEDIGGADGVVFIDADVNPGEARLEPVEPGGPAQAPLAHSMGPEEVLALARRLYGFRGEALLCRVPGVDFSDGAGLSAAAERNARVAALLIQERCLRRRESE